MDSVGIRISGLRCSWWNPRHANDTVASKRSIFSENHDYKRVFRVMLNLYVPIFRGLDACGGRKLRTETHAYIHTYIHTHTWDNYSNPCAQRGLMTAVSCSIYVHCIWFNCCNLAVGT